MLKLPSTLINNACNQVEAKRSFGIFCSKGNVNTIIYPTLVPTVFAFVCQTIAEELHTNDYQYKTSVNLYSEKIKMDKNFFKVAGKPKMLANMPNGIAGRNFGQGLPPVKVTLNKMSRNGKDSNLKIEKLTKKHEFFSKFLLKKDARHLKTRVWKC